MATLKFPSRIDLPEETRARLVDLLNRNLANTIVLSLQVKQAHWNVRGPNFQFVHELFDTILVNLREHSDETAERAAMLGGVPVGTARQIAQAATVDEYDFGAVSAMQHLHALSERYAVHATELRKAVETAAESGDPATEDLFTAQLRAVEKDLWFLESHLHG
ncbi:MAG: DNA starvation/stationary phase protection protein Dps [Deltaproteobacteria bacterium]|nr:MAG: DNA starvation/stationary phase protection protein Dps [Deltaproteobacteria bacterium]